MGMDQNSRASVALSLAKSLVEKQEFYDAAVIYQDHLKDFWNAVETLCQGEHYDEAYRLAAISNDGRLFKTVEDQLIQSSTALLIAAEGSSSRLDKAASRLLQLQNRTAEPDDNTAEYDWDDSISLVSILTTTSQRSTTPSETSSQGSYTSKKDLKSRRKGRKGTVYEIEHLKHELYSIKRSCAGYQDQLAVLAATLIRNGHRARTVSLGNSLQKLVRKLDSLSLESDLGAKNTTSLPYLI